MQDVEVGRDMPQSAQGPPPAELRSITVLFPAFNEEMNIRNAMARALAMPLEERKERFESMMGFLNTHDVNRWCDDFLKRLASG